MYKETIAIILVFLFIPFSFAQKREQLDSVFISNKNLSAEEIIEEVNRQISKNYFVDTISFTIKKEFIKKLNYIEFDIDQKKLKLISKNRRGKFKKEISNFIKKTKNSTSLYSYENTFSFQQKRFEKPFIKPISSPRITSNETHLRNISTLTDEFEILLSNYIDNGKDFTIKTGIIPIKKGLKIKSKTLHEGETNQVLNGYSWPKQKIINPSVTPFLSDSEAYHYNVEKTFFYQNQKVYKVNFKPKKSRATLMGYCIISATDFGILKVKYNLAEGKKAWGFNLKFPLGVKISHDMCSGEFAYNKIKSGKYIPKYYHFSEGEYTYFHRDLLIKTQNGFFKRSDKLKVKLLIESQEITTEKYTFSPLK